MDQEKFYADLNKKISQGSSIEPLQIDGNYSVTDWESNPKNIERFEIITEYLANSPAISFDAATSANDDDMAEFLRDDNARIETAVAKAIALKDAPENVKQAYRELKADFNKSSVTGLKEHLEMALDYGVDGVANYANAATIAAAAISGGLTFGAGAAAPLAARKGMGEIARKSLNAALKATNPTSVKGMARQGAILGATGNVGTQTLEKFGTEEREQYSPVELGLATGLGYIIGGGFGAGVNYAAGKLGTRRIIDKATEELPSPENKTIVVVTPQSNKSIDIDAEFDSSPEQLALKFNIEPEEAAAIQQEIEEGLVQSLREWVIEQDGTDELFNSDYDELKSLVLDFGDATTPEQVASSPALKRIVEKIGGGQETFDELVDGVLASAHSASTNTTGALKNLAFALHRASSGLTSGYMFGKAGGFLSPYTSLSPTAKQLQNKTSTEFAMSWLSGQETIAPDFAETKRNILGRFQNIFEEAVSPLSSRAFNTKLRDEVNSALSFVIRGGTINEKPPYAANVNIAATKIREAYKGVGELLNQAGYINITKNYIPRQWKRSAIEKNPDKFKKLLIEEGEAANETEASIIVKDMLDKKYLVGEEGTTGYFFTSARKFNNIKNDSKFEEFLNTDVKETFFNYMASAAGALAKKKVFGVKNLEEFQTKWIEKIASEYTEATGKPFKDRDKLVDLYKTLTNEGAEKIGTYNATYQLINRMAYLGFAVPSSLTEILLNFGVAGFPNTFKGIARAATISKAKLSDDVISGFKELTQTIDEKAPSITTDLQKNIMDEFGLTEIESWRELKKVGLALEQALASSVDRLGGETGGGEKIHQASNVFFRATFLDQWTKIVQNASFQSGKLMIRDHIKDIINHGTAPNTRRIQRKLDDLAELGVDIDRAKAWFLNGANKDVEGYEEIVNGAGRYANQIILQPERASGLKPRWQYTPTGSLFTQLLAYPTAFSNNVLKRGLKRISRDVAAYPKAVIKEGLKKEGIPGDVAKMASAAFAMTLLATTTNYIRARGEGYEDKTGMDMTKEAIIRWGGLGLPLESVSRTQDNLNYKGLWGVPSAFLGPVYNDLLLLGRIDPLSLGFQKVPLYSTGNTILGKETMAEYRQKVRQTNKEIIEGLTGSPPPKVGFKKGGEVNVPQAPEEPDERIDKMTGRPYNQQAGEAFMDEEELNRSLLART